MGEGTLTYILPQNDECTHYPRVTYSKAGTCLDTLVNIGFQWILCFLNLFSCLSSEVLMTGLYMFLIFLCMLAGAHDPYLSIWFSLSPMSLDGKLWGQGVLSVFDMQHPQCWHPLGPINVPLAMESPMVCSQTLALPSELLQGFQSQGLSVGCGVIQMSSLKAEPPGAWGAEIQLSVCSC